jgi:hypothetical protein
MSEPCGVPSANGSYGAGIDGLILALIILRRSAESKTPGVITRPHPETITKDTGGRATPHLCIGRNGLWLMSLAPGQALARAGISASGRGLCWVRRCHGYSAPDGCTPASGTDGPR